MEPDSILLSTRFFAEPPQYPRDTQVEIWGSLPTAKDDRESHFRSRSFETFVEDAAPKDDTTPQIHAGTQLRGLNNVPITHVAVGLGHAVFVANDGRAYAYGSNNRGQLGVGDYVPRHEPVQLQFSQASTPFGDTCTQTSSVESKAYNWFFFTAACGSNHTVMLGSSVRSGVRHILSCGALDSTSLDHDDCDLRFIEEPAYVAAIAARADTSCCGAPLKLCGEASPSCTNSHGLYFWGDVSCCTCLEIHVRPTPRYQLPSEVRAVSLGDCFGLALDIDGLVYAWGDGTYGELGVVPMHLDPIFRDTNPELRLPVPKRLEFEGRESSMSVCRERSDTPRIADIACGKWHALLLDVHGRLYTFGDSFAGQCGHNEVRGCNNCSSIGIQFVQIETPHGEKNELGMGVYAGGRHSGLISTANHLFLWGHPSNRKLGIVGINQDGTEAGMDPRRKQPKGVAVRSPICDSVSHPRMVYSLLNRRLCVLGLGDECTIIVTGNQDDQ